MTGYKFKEIVKNVIDRSRDEKQEYSIVSKWLHIKDKVGEVIEKRGIHELLSKLEKDLPKTTNRKILENIERTLTDEILQSKSIKIAKFLEEEVKFIPSTIINLKASLARRDLTQMMESSLENYFNFKDERDNVGLFNHLCDKFGLPDYKGDIVQIAELGWDGDPNGKFEEKSWIDQVFKMSYTELTRTFYPFLYHISHEREEYINSKGKSGKSWEEWFTVDGMSMSVL